MWEQTIELNHTYASLELELPSHYPLHLLDIWLFVKTVVETKFQVTALEELLPGCFFWEMFLNFFLFLILPIGLLFR